MKETTAITEEGTFEWPPKNAHYKQRGVYMKPNVLDSLLLNAQWQFWKLYMIESQKWLNQNYILYVIIRPSNNPWIFHVISSFGEISVYRSKYVK